MNLRDLSSRARRAVRATLGPTYGPAAVAVLLDVRTAGLRLMRSVKSRFAPPARPLPVASFGRKGFHTFFGYYDVTPLDADGTRLLAMQVRRGTAPGEPAALGYFDPGDPAREFVPFAQTTAWCWQQGARLQWYPSSSAGRNRTVIYNIAGPDGFGAEIFDLDANRAIRRLGSPVYAITPDGKTGVTLNFSRLGRLRPGYGYEGVPDKGLKNPVPDDDGIFAMDMETGETRLLFSLADMAGFHPHDSMRGASHYFNHACVNPAGTRFFFFHVWTDGQRRKTRLITADMDGGGPYPLVDEGHVSHYAWKSADEILCFSTHAETGTGYHLYKDRTGERKRFSPHALTQDGHPSFSPDGRFVLTDTYPDRFGDRHILLCHAASGKTLDLGAFFSPLHLKGETRCDLHPRWSPTGRRIAFDSAHGGTRRICVMDVSVITGED